MTIRILDADLAGKIAAGEVVERPASIVKELVENSLDAGSTAIHVELRGGGVQLIRVTDNGSGIDEAELELAFERHATSKLTSLDDLDRIQSLGFRGEALPSIRSVAEVAVQSRPPGADYAAFVRFDRGQVVEKGRRGAPFGTQLTVRNMFEAIPARLRFLRQASTEASQAVNVVVQYALAYPDVRFTVDVDGKAGFRSPGSGLLKDAMLAAYGKEVAGALLEVASDLDGSQSHAIQLAGLVTKPSVSRGNRAGISFFINRRWVQSRMLTQAVESAFQNRLMVNRHPIGVFHLAIPYESVDVNVHPAKTEVRLMLEREAFSVVQRAVKDALERAIDIPAMTVFSAPSTGTVSAPEFSGDDGFQTRIDLGPEAEQAAPDPERIPALRLIGQVGTTYLIAEGPDGMYLVDQHAAHERVMFELVRLRLERGDIESQGLLEPVLIDLSVEQNYRLEQSGTALAGFGFEIEQFGEKSVAVRAIPALIKPGRATATVLEAIESLSGNPLEWRDKIAATVACHAAVRAGQLLSEDEMRQLIADLERTPNPRSCPHGRPTMLHLSAAQLEREFGRR